MATVNKVDFSKFINQEKQEKKSLVDKFLDSLPTSIRKNTIDTYRRHIEVFLSQASQITSIPVDQEEKLLKAIDIDVVETWRNIVLKEKIYKKSSYNGKLIALKEFFDYLYNTRHLVEYNPFTTIRRERINRGDTKEKEIFTKEELNTFLNSIDELVKGDTDTKVFLRARTKFLIALCSSCGYRINEALQIKLEDLTTREDGIVKVYINGERIKNHIDRNNVICGKTLDYYKEYMETRKRINVESDLLLPTYKGTKVDYKDINKWLKAKVKEAGIDKHISTHCFRHYCSSYLSTLTTETVKCSILGWKLDGMSSIYTHDTEEMTEEKIRVCSQLI